MKRSDKKNFVQKLKDELNSSSSVIVAHYAGLSVLETDKLRKEMRDNGAKFKVTKNRLTKLALADTPYESIADLFSGPTAIAYSSDPVLPAKVAVSFEKKLEINSIIYFKGFYYKILEENNLYNNEKFFYGEKIMSLLIGDTAPNFKANTTKGKIDFHEFIGDNWCILFSHPASFTPVCTTELGRAANLELEFKKRNVKIITISVDQTEDQIKWIEDINETQNSNLEFMEIQASASARVARLS